MIKLRTDVERYIPMNEGSGNTFFDHSVNGKDGTRVGGDWIRSGNRGQACPRFNGSGNEYATFPNIPCDTNPKTIISWVFPRQNVATFLSQDNATGNSQLYFRMQSGSVLNLTYATQYADYECLANINTAFMLNRWMMMSAVFTGSVFRGYLNGKLLKEISPANRATVPVGTGLLNYGRNNANNDYWNGYMSGLYIFNKALSSAEVKAFYKNTMH